MRPRLLCLAAAVAAGLPVTAWAQLAPSVEGRDAMRAFAILDQDSDGALTPEDAPWLRRMASQLLVLLDRDRDTRISRREFITGGARSTWWSILDDNGDGAIDSDELRARMSPALVEGLDLNGDDRVTAGELRPGLPAPAPPSPPPEPPIQRRAAEPERPRSQPVIIGDQFFLGLDVEPGDYR